MSDVGIYRDGGVEGSYGWTKLCNRSELWAAIEAIERDGWVAGNQAARLNAEDADRARLAESRARVRALLGMEAD